MDMGRDLIRLLKECVEKSQIPLEEIARDAEVSRSTLFRLLKLNNENEMTRIMRNKVRRFIQHRRYVHTLDSEIIKEDNSEAVEVNLELET